MTKSPVFVVLPTHTKPVYNQRIFGKQSPLSPDLNEFRGIPFGVVPGRWQHSHVREQLPEDEYKAWSNGPKCPQSPDFNNSETWQSRLEFPADVGESELDCLNLFIIRPSASALEKIGWDQAKKLPVMVWIHGGGYGFGASTDPMWDPSRLVLQSISLGAPIIAVNINYRLGIFGFGASSEILQAQSGPGVRGCNFGLRDQKVGLQWVSQNIAAFGGDPTKITLGGQSAGGCSAHIHVLEARTRREKSLFRHACIQSGAAGILGPITMAEANHHWETLCRHLGIDGTSETCRLNRLLSLSAEALVNAAWKLRWYTFALVDDNLTMTTKGELGNLRIPFAINLGEISGEYQTPYSGSMAILIGDTETEASIFSNSLGLIGSFSEVQSIFNDAFTSSILAEKILDSYGLTADITSTQLRRGLTKFLTDCTFGYPVDCARNSLMKQQLVVANEPAVYQHTTVQSYRIKFGNPFPGPCYGVAQHCVELIYLFDAFHDHIAVVDAAMSEAGSPISCDSGYLSQSDETAVDKLIEASVSNAALREELQRKWISFIAEDQNEVQGAQSTDGDEAQITIYGEDRRVAVESLKTGVEWTEQRKRFDLLAADWKGVNVAFKTITSGVLM